MQKQAIVVDIPKEVGYRICDEIRQENRRKPFRVMSGLWCWGCMTFTGGDPEKRCGATVACPQVIKRFQLPY